MTASRLRDYAGRARELLVRLSMPEEPTDGRADPLSREKLRLLFHDVAEHCDLPPLPVVAVRALSLARDPNARIDDLTRVVATDQALAARVLRISHSVRYAQRRAPRGLRDAIMAVGFHALRKILIAASCRQFYRADDAVAEMLWSHALATALAADELGALEGEPRGGDGFIAGLLHDVGRLVLHMADPAAYGRLLLQDEERERYVFGVTHPAVGGCLAAKWGLEEQVVEGILSHHAAIAPRLAARVAKADRIAHAVGLGSLRRQEIAPAPETEEPPEVPLVGQRVIEAFAAESALFA